MRFYTRQHRFYCGVDLHARTMHVCPDWSPPPGVTEPFSDGWLHEFPRPQRCLRPRTCYSASARSRYQVAGLGGPQR
jgi:hypothetical protein